MSAPKGKYSKKVVDVICDCLSRMQTKSTACKTVGITLKTFCEWYNDKPEFKERIDQTFDELLDRQKNKAVQTIFKAMDDGAWQSAAWFLERKFPAEYARKDKVDMDITEKKIVFQIGIKNNDSNLVEINPSNDIKLIENKDTDE